MRRCCEYGNSNTYTMKKIIEEATKAVERGLTYSLSLKEKTLKIGRKYIIRDGKSEVSYDDSEIHDALSQIDGLYAIYKHSVPSARSESSAFFRKAPCFKALSLDELSQDDLICGESRVEARIKLEVFVLMAVISGKFKWDDTVGANKFFYQSPNDKDLILLRDWA